MELNEFSDIQPLFGTYRQIDLLTQQKLVNRFF